MILQKLSLANFRNFNPPSSRLRQGKERKFVFSPKTTLVVGPNTSGKTSLLEAIYLLAAGKSFRAERSEEMIRFGREIARVRGVVSDGDRQRGIREKYGATERRELKFANTDLEVVLTRGMINGKRVAKKRFLVNGVARRWPKFVGNFYGVIFRPEDIDLVGGPPLLRRDYLDEVLGQVDREYQRSLLSYKKGLRQRNKLLEKAKAEPRFRRALQSQLYFWDKLLVKNGQLICRKRETYLEFVNRSLAEKSDIQVGYRKNVMSEKRLAEWREREMAIGMTMIGPQRDDFMINSKFKNQNEKLKLKIQNFSSSKRDLALYGSRGEHRLAVLYLKMAQLEYILEKTGQKPTLLLDDIFAELDVDFRREVIKLIDNQQTVVTAVKEERVKLKEAEVVRLLG